MLATTEKRWYLVQCRPKQDLRALEHLQRQGYECLLPMHKVEKLKHGQRLHQDEPLFPGYLFIELDSCLDNWMPIRSTRGVSQIVRFGAAPLAVPKNIVERFRQSGKTYKPNLCAGDKIQISWAGTHGIEAVFLAKDGAERILILLNILHRELQISIPVQGLIKAG
ncbi:transcription/translation regulatory transformer protein RfaH [Pseudomonas sp. GCEP-101]|uniref:transcription/translation regulatory transformer protein RfaH n=1 Tax=Pseudomonas sp. GCEP-101 TaxID=2974552 RepID=UPI00223B7F98|nr:transcription/translation regulatory transformer protein RfaH [Pseudomonas sp. GCEP-101]